MEENLSIINKTKGKIPNLPFSLIKQDILNKKYNLSIVFIGNEKMKKLNNQYRKINKATNILSFPLSTFSGEIFICPNIVKKELKKFNKNFKEMLGFLVIHGMLHLKGREHNAKMEREETFYDKKYFSRNRYRVNDDKSNRRRIYKGTRKS